MNAQGLYVGFSRSRGGLFSQLLGLLIRFFTGGRVNHALFLYRDEHLGWMTIGANENGVTYLPLEVFLKTRQMVDIFVPAKDPSALWVGLQSLRDDIGKSYNFSGLVGMAGVEIATRWLHLKHASNWLSNPNDLFCSEIVAEVIRRSHFSVLDGAPADTIAPAALDAALSMSAEFIRPSDLAWMLMQ